MVEPMITSRPNGINAVTFGDASPYLYVLHARRCTCHLELATPNVTGQALHHETARILGINYPGQEGACRSS